MNDVLHVDERLAALPIEPFAAMLRAMRDRPDAREGFRDWFDLAGSHGPFERMVLLALTEMEEHGSDPGEVLRCVQSALRLTNGGVRPRVSLTERLRTLRPPEYTPHPKETKA